MKAFLSMFAQQIASAIVDQPYSGFLVNQSIDENYTVLQYETERSALPIGTYPLSMPSGLASNKHSVLFVGANAEATLTITTRDYANLADNVLIATVSAEEPFYSCLHNIKSATITTSVLTEVETFTAKIQTISAASLTSPNQGIDPGSLPVGGIIAISGTFTAPGVGYTETGILPFPSYLQLCDGSLCNDPESIFFGKFVPNLTNDVTLVGSTTAGVSSQSSTTGTILTGFGSDWNIYRDIPVSPTYSVKYYIRIK